MSFDYGTNKLGIKNPFKPEGYARTITGALITLFAIYILISVSADVKQDMLKAWADILLGLAMLYAGLKITTTGTLQLFRYYVGRAVPTSLAQNINPSEQDPDVVTRAESRQDSVRRTVKDKAKKEHHFYENAKILESMLMGRKNTTFEEPRGWVARLVNTLLPSLLITPYPIRNFVQQLGSLLATTAVAFAAFGLAYFISVSGLVGKSGQLITPVLSFILLVYLTTQWLRTARAIDDKVDQESSRNRTFKGTFEIAIVLGMAILVPIITSQIYSRLGPQARNTLQQLHDSSIGFSAWFNLTLLIALSAFCIASVWLMIRERLAVASAPTEVSEFRANLQESVHPKEIFIHIENIVLSNRRYKEIPNRLYKAFDPKLEETTAGKGNFRGELIIETQPAFEPIEFSQRFKIGRLISTIAAQILALTSAILAFYAVEHLVPLIHQFSHTRFSSHIATYTTTITMTSSFLKILFSFFTVFAAAMVMNNGTHLFWSEMHFNSLLMWMKTEGTFTESKISTGMSIHDSTRSENVVVRCSITPWIITSRIITSTFAATGLSNLERPRMILKMNKNDEELEGIVEEIRSFLHGRETIASINNQADLQNTGNIFQVNQQTRSHMSLPADESAAGHLRQEETSET